jgi:energy-coupling factor transporter ATP-binding protein EcfA2
MDMGAMGAMGEMPKDQGPSGFENALKNLKQDFYDEISGFVMKTKDMEKIQSYLKNMSVAYSNSLQKLKKEFGITEAFPNEQLLTPSFLTEIKNMLTAPGMQAGDLVGLVQKPEDLAQYGLGSFPWNVWQGLSDEEKQRLLKAGGSALLGTQQVDTTKQQQVMERINKIIEERKQLAGQSAVMPQTKQGGILGFATQVNALRAGQAAAKDKVLADELEMIRLGNQLGSRAQGQGPQFTATIRDAIFDDDEGPIIDKDEIYKQVMQQATDANFIRKLGNAALPSDYVSVQLAITGHGDIVDAHDESLAAIKTYKEAPTKSRRNKRIRRSGSERSLQSKVWGRWSRAV